MEKIISSLLNLCNKHNLRLLSVNVEDFIGEATVEKNEKEFNLKWDSFMMTWV